MPRRHPVLVVCALALVCGLLPSAAARAALEPGGPVPGGCQVEGFGTRVGTDAADVVVASPGSELVYGLGGDDWVVGSLAEPSCLFGGLGDDVITLTRTGGIGLGEEGDDTLTGDEGADALTGGPGADSLAGGDGPDVLVGNQGVDGFSGGPGDDTLESADGVAEVVNCGAGTDTTIADRSDVLIDCERGRQSGRALKALTVKPARGGARRTFRLHLRFPHDAETGGYRVLLASPCGTGLRQVASVPSSSYSIAAGDVDDIRLRPPAGGWCRGTTSGLVVFQPPCEPGHACQAALPVEPVGRVVLRVR